MNKQLLLLAFFAICFSGLNAQAPQAFNYQGIARNAAGLPLNNQAITLRLTIHDLTATGTPVYKETHAVTTNQFGLYVVNMGQGLAVSGTFNAINWAVGNKYIEHEVNLGAGFINMGVSQFLSVPYALYSGNSSAVSYTSGAGIAIVSGSVITNAAPNQTVTVAPGLNTAVSGVYPNYTVNATPSLSLSGVQLSISNGNSVTLPTGTTYTPGSGISITSGSVISNTAPDQVVSISGPGVSGVYPNFVFTPPASSSVIAGSNVTVNQAGNAYTVNATAPVISGTGLATVNNSALNYTVSVPTPTMSFNNATGTYSYTQGAYSNTINLSPNTSFSAGTLTVGSNTTTIPGTGIWGRSAPSVTLTNNTDNVGIGVPTPGERLVVNGNTAIPATNQYKYLTPKTLHSSISALAFNTESTYNRQNLAGGIYIVDGAAGVQGNLYAGVDLPDGAVITTLDAYVLDNDGAAGHDIAYAQLWRQDGLVGSAYGNAIMVCATGGTSITSSVIQKITTSTISSGTVDNTNYTYYIRVGSVQAATNLMLFKVVITYTVLAVE